MESGEICGMSASAGALLGACAAYAEPLTAEHAHHTDRVIEAFFIPPDSVQTGSVQLNSNAFIQSDGASPVTIASGDSIELRIDRGSLSLGCLLAALFMIIHNPQEIATLTVPIT